MGRRVERCPKVGHLELIWKPCQITSNCPISHSRHCEVVVIKHIELSSRSALTDLVGLVLLKLTALLLGSYLWCVALLAEEPVVLEKTWSPPHCAKSCASKGGRAARGGSEQQSLFLLVAGSVVKISVCLSSTSPSTTWTCLLKAFSQQLRMMGV